ncbi:DUF2726 domain-containing protein [Pseudomonas sp. LRF_L74]|uniref:DUF2726 domain-containing protein n=1 Tax=Pseudomonas sp. LRF_L74 TaxID=3369422 RepID=UPI003F62AF13
MAQVTTFFEAELFTFAEPLQAAQRAKQFEFTNLIIALGQHGFSQGFVDRFVDERLKLMQETKHSALLNYAQSYQHRPWPSRSSSLLQTKPEVGTGKAKTIHLFKSKQQENFYEVIPRFFPTYHFYPNVALSSVLNYPDIKDQLSEKSKSYFFQTIIDSVVFDVSSGHEPRYFIELDSSFHDETKAQANDQLKDSVFRAANTKLIRVRLLNARASSVEEFEKLVREVMRQLSTPQASLEQP